MKTKNYQWLYVVSVAIFTGVVVNRFAFYLNLELGLEHNGTREFFISFGQIIWQMTAISFLDRSKTLVYLLNMSTVSLLGGVLLLPILGLNMYYPFSIIGLIFSFGVIVIIMLFEHLRRCKRLEISILMTASWVMFRTVALGIVLILSI
ncbi:MAG TPA: hypothetical protein EYG94_05885 [Campylobacterales bacterium]|nr:hypothetical protein [Campylobacterales bacterium]